MLQAFEEQEDLSLKNIPTHHPQHTFSPVQLEAACVQLDQEPD
jgi:hypothetical protein